jgi:hypothetical protein
MSNDVPLGTRIPHRFRHHYTSKPLRPSPALATADCPPCAYFRGRSSHCTIPGGHPATPTDLCSEQQELEQPERIRTTEQWLRPEQRLRRRQSDRREEQQLLPASARCDTTTPTSLRCSSWTPSAGELPSSCPRHSSVRLQLYRRWRPCAPAQRPDYCYRVHERRMVEGPLCPHRPGGYLPSLIRQG